ncbi:MAG: flagellar type III secretion system pore protein FliP [Romboutsia sp.]|nr:flagellar type III secretion system pore protein FliP [Romboutsia sp.]
MKIKKIFTLPIIVIIGILLLSTSSFAEPTSTSSNLPYFDFIKESSTPEENVFAVKTFLIFTVLSLAPSILITITPFVRIIIVLSIMRQSLGLQQTPPNQVLVSLALFLTLISISPIISEVNDNSIKPYLESKITIEEAFNNANKPLREFMFNQVGDTELALFINLHSDINNVEAPEYYKDVPNTVLIPAFMVSEVKKGVFIGVLISIAFIVIDLATASVLMGMGMMMVSPMVVSFIFKVLLFVMVNGFDLIIQTTMYSFKY